MSHYPVMLTDLEAGAIVVGGGQVAARKVAGLLAGGARVTVISPKLTPELEELAAQECIAVERRAYRPGDLTAARLVIAATDSEEVNLAVWQEARERGILVNVVDDPAHCTFHVPAVIRRGPVTVAVGTGGASPALARHLREMLSTAIGDEYGALAAIMVDLRPRVRTGISDEVRREALWRELIETLLPLLREGCVEQARQMAETLLQAGRVESLRSAGGGKENS